MSRKEHPEGYRWIDRINPVVIFEARQISRNRITLGANIMFLTLIFGIILINVLANSHKSRPSFTEGRDIFTIISVVLCIATLLIVPLFTGIRMQMDRDHLPLLFVTPVTPSAFLRGKISSAAMLAGLNISLCAPFMVFAVMLRGVDYLMIATVLAGLFFATLLLSEVFLFIACLPMKRQTKLAVSILFFLMGGPQTLMFFIAAATFSRTLGGTTTSSPIPTGWIIPCALALCLSGILFLHQCNCMLLSPKTSNRAFPFRLWATGILLFWAIVAGIASFVQSDGEIIMSFVLSALFAITTLVPVGLVGSLRPSPRVRRDIPASFLRRCLAFPWFNGAANGLLWLALLTIPLLLAVFIFSATSNLDLDEGQQIISAVFYIWGYGQVALYLYSFVNRVCNHQLAQKSIWLFFILVAAIANVLPHVVTFCIRQNAYSKPLWTFGAVTCIPAYPEDAVVHLLMSAFILVVFTALNLSEWWMPQIKAFQPLATKKDA